MNNTYNGFLIHTRDYKETSSLISIFTSQHGLKSLLFKGKHTNKERFKFSLFNEYSFTFNNKYNLPYLSKFENIKEYRFDKKFYVLGMYINELLYKTIKEGFDFDKVYVHYKDFLINLSNSNDSLNRMALLFEKKLLQDLGYELTLSENTTLDVNNEYYYDYSSGFKVNVTQNNDVISGKNLHLFFINTLTQENAIKNLRSVIRNILRQIYPEINLIGDKLF